MITRSWHMYPLGMLFGLGFDTATEIGLLAISAAEASRGLPLYSTLVFPCTFCGCRNVFDRHDRPQHPHAGRGTAGLFVKPIRKLYYNMTITCVSVVVALVVGGIEALGLVAGYFSFPRQILGRDGESSTIILGTLGYFIVGLLRGELDYFDCDLQMAKI